MAPARNIVVHPPGLLILSSPPASEIQFDEDRERFLRFVEVARTGGFRSRHEFVTCISELSALIRVEHPDLIFSCLHALPRTSTRDASPDSGFDPEIIEVHRFLEDLGIPYVGSAPDIIRLALHKSALKTQWLAAGVATPAFIVFDLESGSYPEASSLPSFPCIVKPEAEGNSRGIVEASIVHDEVGLKQALDICRGTYSTILIEHYLGQAPDFREFTVALIESCGKKHIMPAELTFKVPTYPPLITNAAKDGHKTRAIPVSDPVLHAQICAFASQAFEAAGVRDYARCDMAMAEGRLQGIEINGQPMVPDRWFAACCSTAALDEPGYLASILYAACRRLQIEGRGQNLPLEHLSALIPAHILTPFTA